MNEDVNENRKLFWKEVTKAKGVKVENCSRIKWKWEVGTVQRIWRSILKICIIDI